MDDQELRTILGTICQLLLETQEKQFQLDKMARCAEFAFVEGAPYAHAYTRKMEELSRRVDPHYGESLRALTEVIQRLRG